MIGQSPTLTDERNFFWLVGLLEGEGSFLRPSPSRPNEPKVDIEMRDEDVIKRVAALFGLSYRKRDRHRENVSITYHVRMGGKAAARLMWRLRPYLCARRQEQIDRAIQCYIDRGVEWHPGSWPAYEFKPVCAHSLCANKPVEDTQWCADHIAPS